QLKDARERNDDTGDPMRGGMEKGPREGKPKTKEELEKEIKGLLDKAKKLLKKKPNGDEPEFPEQPFEDDGKEKKAPPREEDSDEPLPMKDKKKEKEDGEKEGKKPEGGEDMKKDDEDDKGFQPRLGGPKEKLDPRYKDKKRPSPKKEPKEGDDKDGKDEKGDESGKLDAAEKALGSDSKSLEKMLDAFAKGQKGKGEEGKEGQGELNALAEALRQMMADKGTKEARAMARAAKALKEGMRKGQAKGGDPKPSPSKRDEGNLEGGRTNEKEGKLATLDPSLKAMMLKLPPRVREDLIQGLKAQGPEAYRAFVEDYRKRLNAER
ncbi:MAG: hypothetical protein K2W96_20770, partial [Gemmataceae bacterium]|nr:hypothetical protein [Gemmataceae bacterium]